MVHLYIIYILAIWRIFPPDLANAAGFSRAIFSRQSSSSAFKRQIWHISFFVFWLQKPYKCEVLGCTKRYTDPSSLRKHVKSHSQEEQLQYRRSKDLANMAKRSCSPTARYSSWTPSSSSSAVIAAVQKTREMKWKFIMYYYFTGIFWIFLWKTLSKKSL